MSQPVKKSVVLLSAGMDSTVNLYAAQKHTQVALALTFNYGQKAAPKEIQAAQKLTAKLQIKHRVLDLDFFKDFGQSSLIMADQKIPTQNEVKIDDLATSQQTAKSVWVPNRNGIFLNVAAGFAESLGAEFIVPGFNKEEAATFPDNSLEFLDQTTRALSFSTSNRVKLQCWTTNLIKTEIVKYGNDLGVDWSLMWPCYQSLTKWCGECESCKRSKRALQTAGLATAAWFLNN